MDLCTIIIIIIPRRIKRPLSCSDPLGGGRGGGGGGNDGRIDIREGADSGRGRGGGGISQSRDPGRVICFVHVNQL